MFQGAGWQDVTTKIQGFAGKESTLSVSNPFQPYIEVPKLNRWLENTVDPSNTRQGDRRIRINEKWKKIL